MHHAPSLDRCICGHNPGGEKEVVRQRRRTSGLGRGVSIWGAAPSVWATSVGGGGPLPAASVGCERCSWCFSCRSTQVPLCETSQPATILWVWVMRSPPCYSSRDTASESPYFIILFLLTTSFLLSFELCRLAGTFNSN